MPLFSYAMRQLALGNSTRGAGVGTSTAIDAGTGVDHVVVIALSDSTNGASALASATAHASVGPFGRWTYLVKFKIGEGDALITREKFEELQSVLEG